MPSVRFVFTLLALQSNLACFALQVDFGKRAQAPRIFPREAGTVEITAEKNLYYTLGGSYFANITVGDPPQSIQVQLDTGSPDLGINTPEGFDPSKSSSYRVTYADLFSISYVSNDYFIGDFATDDISFGDTSLKNMTLGVSNNSTVPFSIMGLSPTGIVSNDSIDAIKNNLYTPLQSLVSSGAINSRMFSIWLNDLAAATGSILFGGVDESRFDKDIGLIEIDMLKNETTNKFERYTIPMTGMSITMENQAQDFTLPKSNVPGEGSWLPVTIDTGSPTLLLPQDIFDAINTHVGAITDPRFPDRYGLPCAQAQSPAFTSSYMNWTLGDPQNSSIAINYTLSLADLVIPIYLDGVPVSQKVNGTQIDLCAFGIQPKPNEGTVLIGDPFIRAMYVVFDPDNGKMAFGKPLFNATQTKAIAMEKGQEIPDVVQSEPDKDAASDVAGGPSGNGTTHATGSNTSAIAPVQSSSSGASTKAFAPATSIWISAVMFTVAASFVGNCFHDAGGVI
ncbi:MAG: hypothetical protein Q9157_007504 [Trypethelium eluteriae]